MLRDIISPFFFFLSFEQINNYTGFHSRVLFVDILAMCLYIATKPNDIPPTENH
ncbi:hypothetical protein [Plasmodium yoelii yoelii]|uniref:Uncharacterized protein n=1 Tax=Plasmodium yoelii yoelii TaxID=73239 RepID=Q7RKR0_PLAYO|nr:hypothetical protein [Plasmodium yoelii yoelii]